MIRTFIVLFAGGLFLSLVCMESDREKRLVPSEPQRLEDARVKGFRELYLKTKPDIINSHYSNNSAYVDEVPRLFINSVKGDGNQVVLDLKSLEDLVVKAQGRQDRIETTKFQLKMLLCGTLLCGCSFTLGAKFATILMKNSVSS